MNTRITGLTLIENAEPWQNGDKLIAKFDCETRGMRIRDCLLLRVSRGFVLAQAPRGLPSSDGARLFEIIDRDMRFEIGEAAFAVFVAMGGREQ